MLPSKNAPRSEDLFALTRNVLLSSNRNALQYTLPSSPLCLRSEQRSFSWGAKHKWSTNNHGKNASDTIKKAMISRLGVRYPYLQRQMFLRHYLPAQGWRSVSQWKNSLANGSKKDQEDQRTSAKQRQGEVEDWYCRWERQKKQQYEDFMRKIDQDPFTTLFGKSNKWLGWTGETIARGASAPSVPPSDLKTKAEQYIKKCDSAVEDVKEQMTPQAIHQEAEQSRSDQSKVVKEAEEQNYEIDPITMRKVPKTANTPALFRNEAVDSSAKSFDIPVQVFKNFSSSPATPTRNVCAKPVADWLAQEGFKFTNESQKPMSQAENGTFVTPKASAPKIESALDRHLQDKKSTAAKKPEPSIQYEPKKNETEDVDHLRASEIRASARFRGDPAKESDAVRISRREALEEKFDKQQRYLQEEMRQENRYLKERERQQQYAIGGVAPRTRELKNALEDVEYDPKKEALRRAISHGPKTNETSKANETSKTTETSQINESPAINETSEVANAVVDKTDKLPSFTNEKILQIQAKIVPMKEQIDLMTADYDALKQRWLEEKRRLKVKAVAKLHADEVNAQKSAMEAMQSRSGSKKVMDLPKGFEGSDLSRGEGDMAANVADFCSRGRWYKRKAPHAQDQMDFKIQQPGEGDMAANVADFCSRDRWYKRKAPHAQDRMDAKLHQLAKDKAFVREIRRIYEETYGIIDTKHRQPQIDVPKSDKSGEGYTLLKEDPSDELLKDASASRSESAPESTTHHDLTPISQARQISQTSDLIHQLTNRLRESAISTTARQTSQPKTTELLHKSTHRLRDSATSLTKQSEQHTDTMPTHLVTSDPHVARFLAMYASEAKASLALRNIVAGPTNRSPTFMTDFKAKYGLTSRNCICSDPSKAELEADAAANEAAKRHTENTTTYRVVAYDFAKHRVDSVKLSSEKPWDGETPLTPLQAVKLLRHPGKFLPYLMRLQKMGYEIVAGSPSVVVMKKVRDVDEALYVHREEPVFSGSKTARGSHKRGGKGPGSLKAVLLTGTVTAGMCYAVGVASEALKAGVL